MRSTSTWLMGLAIHVLIGSAVQIHAEGPCLWSQPVDLASVNTTFFEAAPSESRDGRSLYFHSLRPGLGVNDLYVSQRNARGVSHDFGPAVPLGPPISTDFNEVAPALSSDGHYLFFSTDRPGGLGNLDIWVSYRESIHDDFAWQDPVPVPEINSAMANDAGVAYFKGDGQPAQLYFQSNRGEVGATDVYVSEQQPDGSWGPPVLVTELSSPAMDNRLTIRANGKEIFFHSNRSGSTGSDVWTATRVSPTAPWSEPVNVGPPINGPAEDTQPGLSHNGRLLYFSSNRQEPGTMNYDLLVSTRSCADDEEE